MKLSFFSIVIALVFSHCNICGNLPEEEQNRIDSLNKQYKPYLTIENIPCEYIYLNVKYRINEIDTTLVYSIYDDLSYSNNKSGWQTLLVYDKNDKYIFSYSGGNKTYIQTGD